MHLTSFVSLMHVIFYSHCVLHAMTGSAVTDNETRILKYSWVRGNDSEELQAQRCSCGQGLVTQLNSGTVPLDLCNDLMCDIFCYDEQINGTVNTNTCRSSSYSPNELGYECIVHSDSNLTMGTKIYVHTAGVSCTVLMGYIRELCPSLFGELYTKSTEQNTMWQFTM